HFMLWYGLRPLDNLRVAFGRLEQGNFGVRLNEEEVMEIARINEKFNQLAKVLEQSKADNRLLTTKLINMQEEERRQIARELHDEMAPLLFNVQVHTSSVTQVLGDTQKEISVRLQSINDTASRLQERVRLLLRQLRPIELDGLSLEDALKDLIDSWRSKGLSIECTLEGFDQVDALGESVKITIYRIVQECLTNVARHANAQNVTAYAGLLTKDQGSPGKAREKITHEPIIHVCVEDDGQGIREGTPLGLGLVGMRERVEALGGWLELSNIHSKDNRGLRVEATIPLTR
ncbi:MAG: histidine kinase, partial [Gammaproteobacteria bacterium]